jgi:hypothetical protein
MLVLLHVALEDGVNYAVHQLVIATPRLNLAIKLRYYPPCNANINDFLFDVNIGVEKVGKSSVNIVLDFRLQFFLVKEILNRK